MAQPGPPRPSDGGRENPDSHHAGRSRTLFGSPRDSRTALFARPMRVGLEHRKAPGTNSTLIEGMPSDVVGVVAWFAPAARAPDLAGEVGALWVHVSPSRSIPEARCSVGK